MSTMNRREKRREDMLHVGSPVWVDYLNPDRPIAAIITAIIVHTDGRLYATCADRTGNERGWISLKELTPR